MTSHHGLDPPTDARLEALVRLVIKSKGAFQGRNAIQEWMSSKVQQTPRKGIVDVVKERFKEAHRRRDAGDTLKRG